MTDRALRKLAGGLLVLSTLLLLATMVATVVARVRHLEHIDKIDFWTGFILLIAGFVYAGTGTLIARQQPRNAIGWLLIAVATSWALGFSVSTYAEYGLKIAPGSLPAPALANALVVWTWVPAVGLMATFVVLLFPDGHLPSPRWRWLAWTSGTVMAVIALGFMTDPRANSDSALEGVANPLGIDKPPWFQSVEIAIFALFPMCMVACAVAAIMRYRRTTGVERLQMKWLVTAGAFFAIFFASMIGLSAAPAVESSEAWLTLTDFVLPASFLLFPLAIGAAVLKYRLYDIDVVINRSLVFGALATFITLVYVAIVVGIGHLFSSGDRPNLALSVAATAVVAVAFEPVRDRLQRFANRVVYGERATPYEVLSDFADRMGGAYDATELLPTMARTVGQGVDASRSQVWLRREDGFELASTWTSDGAALVPSQTSPARLELIEGDRITEVRDRGELLGVIAVVKKLGTELTPVEERLLETLSTQAGPVLRNVRLIEDLRSSRRRLVATQDEERRRLERNLHDGAQQSLVALALMLRLVQSKVAAQDERAGVHLEQASEELGRAVEELRDLARGIYPVVLTERGLSAALSSLAERLPVPIVVEDRLAVRAAPDIERALYFVAFEALTSSDRAGAREVLVGLNHSGGILSMRVDDDGSPLEDPSRGLAVQNLLDRAAVVDASLEVVDGTPGLHLVCTVAVPGVGTTGETEDADVPVVPMGAG